MNLIYNCTEFIAAFFLSLCVLSVSLTGTESATVSKWASVKLC